MNVILELGSPALSLGHLGHYLKSSIKKRLQNYESIIDFIRQKEKRKEKHRRAVRRGVPKIVSMQIEIQLN